METDLVIGPFTFLPDYKVLVCRLCAFAVLVDEVGTHLQKRHRDINSKERWAVINRAAELQGARRNQGDLLGFQFPPPTIDYVPYLAPPREDGLKCRECTYISRQIQKIKEHCKTKHKWKNARGPGRPESKRKMTAQGELLVADDSVLLWREGVRCQRFFLSRYASGWFEVGRKAINRKYLRLYNAPDHLEKQDTQKRRQNVATEASLQEHMAEALRRDQQHFDAEKQPRIYAKHVGNGSLAVLSPWMDRTQWRATYKDARRDILRAMIRLPRKDSQSRRWASLTLGQGLVEGNPDFISSAVTEERIACTMKAVDLIINRCERTALQTSRLIRCWLITSKTSQHHSRAFTVMTEQSTRRRYRDSWRKFIAFLIRLYFLPSDARQEAKVKLPNKLGQLMRQILEHRIWGLFNTEDGQWPAVYDEKYGSIEGLSELPFNEHPEPDIRNANSVATGRRQVSSQHDQRNSDGFEEAYGLSDDLDHSDSESDWGSSDSSLCGGDSTDELADDDMCSDAGSFCHVSDIASADGRKQNDMSLEAANNEFLELLFGLSVAMCKQEMQGGQPGSTALLYFSGIFGFSSDCQQFKLAKDFCPSLSGLIYVQRLLFLESALPLSAYTHLDIPERPADGQLELIQALCSKYIVAGSASSLAELFSLRSFGYMTAQTEGPSFILHWSDDGQTVSLGTELTLSMDQFRTLPDLFISQAEALAQDLLYGLDPDILIAHTKDDITNRHVGYSFVKHEQNRFQSGVRQLLDQATQPHGCLAPLLTHRGWQWRAVKRYLSMVTRLQEQIYGGMYTSGGQTPRLRELQWLLCENTAWASRGVYVWNGSVVYIIKHHKAKRITNKEFYVVRFLPPRLGVVVIKYLAYIQGVQELLRHELHEHTRQHTPWQATRLLFGRDEKPWSTSKCTSILQAGAHEVWKQKLTSQIYRQLAIGITEKHVREVYTPFNQYDDRSVEADKNVAFAMQSGHRPLQRGVTYGLDDAYPHRLQPPLLRAYEWASTRWHIFIRQASKAVVKAEDASSPAPPAKSNTSVNKTVHVNGGTFTGTCSNCFHGLLTMELRDA